MEPEPASTSARRSSRWLVEGIVIMLSVALGFAFAQFGEYRDDRQLAARMLTSIEAELEHNLAILEPMVPIHVKWTNDLLRADVSDATRSGLDLYFATRPELPEGAPSAFPFLRRSAWDAALASGALRLIDYDVATALSEVYRVQEIATDNVSRLAQGVLSSIAIYDPASRVASVRMLWLTLADIESAERLLLDLYRQHVPAIKAAARAAR